MKIILKDVGYNKGYVIGPYLQERPGANADVIIEEGEDQEACALKALHYLKSITDKFHKEANPHLYQEASGNYIQPPKYEQSQTSSIPPVQTPAWSIPVISKDFERIEIEIDNAETPEELKAIKSKYELMPASCLTQYSKKLAELQSGRPQNFSDGLD